MVRKGTVISPIMHKLSAYIASAPSRQLPPAVAERAKHHLLDTISAMVSGSRLLPGRRGIDYVRAVRGSATNPMQRDEIARKSRDLLAPTLGIRRTETLIDAIWNIERISDVRDLRRLLRPAKGVNAE